MRSGVDIRSRIYGSDDTDVTDISDEKSGDADVDEVADEVADVDAVADVDEVTDVNEV